jgi:hypothetical protein
MTGAGAVMDWLLFFSQLVLWALVIHLYRTRAADRRALKQQVDEQAQAESESFDFIDREAMERMSTIRTLLQEIEERSQQMAVSSALPEPVPAGPPPPPSAPSREVLTPIFTGHAMKAYRRSLSTETEEDEPAATFTPSARPQPAPSTEPLQTVRQLAGTGLDNSSIARTTGRQREEVNLLLHLARRQGERR